MACEEAAEEWSKRPDRPHLSGDAERSMVKTRWLKRLRKKMEHGVAELEILKDLSHPNVVGVDAILMSDHTVYIFQELITGGDLWSYLDTYGSPGLTDADATVIVKQLIEATQYLHEHGIVHRDIKPENILMDAWEPGGRIVLSDFGLAKRMPQAQATSQMVSRRKRMHTVVGTAGYAAPEVQLHNNSEITDKGYTCAVDLWSIGAITVLLFTAQSVQDLFPVEEVDELYATNLHSMDSGEPLAGITMDDEGFYPFMATCSQRNGLPGMSQSQSTRLPALSQKLRQREDSDSPNVAGILICDLSSLKDAQHDIWGRIASAPKEFIRQLLVLNESKRMTARQALEHRWLGQPFYKDILQEVYEKAIDGWRPKEQIQIEQLPQVTNIPPPTENDSVLMKVLGQSKSQYFS
ncbi:Meiosis-specific serine/threonine-protein kinase MEK1-like protein [Elsinoe fawcettii]|nr:Meiosis-specific serine/threonine-protein kinase MEK1-like protein [Elsinoe fawcettii]